MSSLPRWIFPVIVALALASASSLAESVRQPGVGLEAGIARTLDQLRSPNAWSGWDELYCLDCDGFDDGLLVATVVLLFGGVPLATFAWLLIALVGRGHGERLGHAVWLFGVGRDLQCASMTLAVLVLPFALADVTWFATIPLLDIIGGLAALPAWRAVIAAAQASRARAVSIRFDPNPVHA